MKKTYKISGLNTSVIRFKLGKGELVAKFDGGIKGTDIPATFTTEKPLAQLAIENSELFNKKVFLYKEYDDEGNLLVKGRRNKLQENVEKKDVSEVDDINGVREYLIGIGVSASKLNSKQNIMKMAVMNNLSFPNLKEE